MDHRHQPDHRIARERSGRGPTLRRGLADPRVYTRGFRSETACDQHAQPRRPGVDSGCKLSGQRFAHRSVCNRSMEDTASRLCGNLGSTARWDLWSGHLRGWIVFDRSSHGLPTWSASGAASDLELARDPARRGVLCGICLARGGVLCFRKAVRPSPAMAMDRVLRPQWHCGACACRTRGSKPERSWCPLSTCSNGGVRMADGARDRTAGDSPKFIVTTTLSTAERK